MNPALVALSIALILSGLVQIVGIAYIARLLPLDRILLAWRLFFLWTSGGLIAIGIALLSLDASGVV